MSTQVQYRRGTASENNAFTGALAEITVDTTNGTLRVHNGLTAGGSNIATVSYVDTAISSLSANSITQGTSNVRVNGPNGNVTISVDSASNVLVMSDVDATFAANILPSANVTYDIGTSTQRFKDIWLANSTIYLGNAQISANATALVITNPAGGTFVVSGAATDIQGASVSVTGNVNSGNLNATGLSLSGNVISALNMVTNITTTGNIAGGYFLGNGSQLTGIDATAIQNGTSNVRVVSSGGNVAIGIGGTSNVLVAATTGAYVIGLASITGNVIGGNVTTVGNITGGNVDITGTTAATTKTTGALTVAGGIGVAGDLYAGNSISVDGGAYGNVVTTQFASVFATGSGPNPRSIMQTRAADGVAGIGIQAYSGINGQIYANTGITFTTGSTLRDKDFPTSGTTRATLDSTGLAVTGIVSASGNVTGGNLIATANVISPNVNTSVISSASGTLTLTTPSGTNNLLIQPTGNVVFNNNYLNNVPLPVQSTDVATKQYVDNQVSSGIEIHPPVYVETPTALNATYTQGGTTPTVDSISGNKTITFTASAALSVNDMIVFTNSFNGITAGTAYFVYSTNGTNQVTLSLEYAGTEITTLTNGGPGLAEPSRANSGVGATLTNAGANAVIQIDGVTLSSTQRVLVYTQANAAQNGIYTVTTAGAPDSPGPGSQWVLTRATDSDRYIPDSTIGMGAGDYAFVQAGATGTGESYVLTLPTGVIIIGTTDITYTQFSASSGYFAGAGLSLGGSTFSVNVDDVTTAIVSGNVVVKTSAQLTTPNIGAATGTSLSTTGNITAPYFLGNGSQLTGIDATAIQSGTSNVRVVSSGGNVAIGIGGVSNVLVAASTGVYVSGLISATGNVIAGNINGILNGSGANVSSISATNISTGTLDQARLANASATVNGVTVTLGSSATITATATNALTIGTGLGGTSYNGSTAVTITNTGVLSLANGGGITASASTGAITLGSTATSLNTLSAIVARDASGNFSAGTITATLSGAATTAGTVTTAAQGNITSVGTLTGLTVSGIITVNSGGAATAIVNGGANAVGNIGSATTYFNRLFAQATTALYADLAEMYASDADYPPGTVLIFGGTDEVTASITTHDHRIAGVVSTNPAHVMNSGLDAAHAVAVALTGRVPTRVQGPVAKGDRMVSSSIPGVAEVLDMTKYQPGVILGKAVEAYTGTDIGIIEVVVGRL